MAKKRKADLAGLQALFEHMPEQWQELNFGLLDNAVFMDEQLRELQKIIREQGITSEWRNGENQGGMRKSPAVDVYNTMIKNYTTVIAKLNEALPDAKENRASEITDFLAGRN